MSMTLTPEVLGKYRNRVFIETGTFDGGGCAVALSVGFERVISMEIISQFHEFAKRRFAGWPQVTLLLGDSSELLPVVLKNIDCPCTFFLDAHLPPDNVEHKTPWTACPTLFELDAIREHSIKTHTIIIDDIDDFGTPTHDDIPEQQVKDRLRLINANYRFVYEKGRAVNTILVAVP